jgi:flagellar motility protein MotE (MotC chaperone)
MLASLLGALLYLGTTFWELRNLKPAQAATPTPTPAGKKAKPTAHKAAAPTVPKLMWDPQNPEVEQLVKELREQKEALATKESGLNELASRLQVERQEIDRVIQEVQRMQTDFEKSLTKVKGDEVGNLKRLGKMYSTMSPDGAAKIIRELDDDSVVKILLPMKEAESAAILEAMAKQGAPEAKRAAGLSERLRVSSGGAAARSK